MTDISRRKLFGAAGAASLGLAGMVPVASASECGKPVKWNETKEFVIIGTGFCRPRCCARSASGRHEV